MKFCMVVTCFFVSAALVMVVTGNVALGVAVWTAGVGVWIGTDD